MIVNIAASHRFHLLDLARELDSRGHDVVFYSYLPLSRVERFGLPRSRAISFLWLLFPLLIIQRITKNSFFSIKWTHRLLDALVSKTMRPCDVFIGLGTVYEKAFETAKTKFGAVSILEWGSKHIEEQQRILNSISGIARQPYYFTRRSLNGYSVADYIAISSDHVRESFVNRGVLQKKLFQNPYGVDLTMFRPTQIVDPRPYDLIVVGGWSYRKGCDLLIDVCRQKNLTLLHVGPIVDLDFPSDKCFTHCDPVDQWKLISYYSMARVFVLPSREEGLAMVQAQAVICGLPVVCSRDSGGRDLREMLNDPKWIVEMNEFSAAELGRCISLGLNLAGEQSGLRSYADDVSGRLSWNAYGSRYHDFILSVTGGL